MIFKRIKKISDINFNFTWDTYNSSFPNYEKRLPSEHKSAISDPNFYANAIYDNNSYIGFIFYWLLDDYIYVEHFAVDERFRNKNYGSKILTKLISDNNLKTIILEIDPPIDNISKRRLNFYERLGFKDNNISHYNLPYQKKLTGYKLNLLTLHRTISEDEYLIFYKLLKESAYKYCEN